MQQSKLRSLGRRVIGSSRIGALYLFGKRAGYFIVGAEQETRYSKSCAAWGTGSRTNGLVEISEPEGLFIGDNVHIGHRSIIRAGGGVQIGSNTHISRECIIYSENHNYEGECLPYDHTTRARPVTIGKNVWIGIRVLILPGATIGDGAIVGAGSTVTGKVEPLTIVGDLKSEEIRSRDKQRYEALEKSGSYGGKGGHKIQ